MPREVPHRSAVVAAVTLVALSMVAAGAAGKPWPGSSPPRHYATVNKSPAYLQVDDDNVENLETANERCRGDWKDLVYYMKVQHRAPDLFLVQQVSNKAQLNKLVATMSRKLAGTYAGIIAKRHPRPMHSPCGAAKAYQTNAVVYRKGRFDYVEGSKSRGGRTVATGKAAGTTRSTAA